MQNKAKTAAAALMLGLLLCVLPLFGQEHRRERGHVGSEARNSYLGLSADQISFIDQEIGNFEKSQQPTLEKLSQFEGQMERALQSGDSAAAGRISLDRVALTRQVNEERKAMQTRLRSILTPGQVEKLNTAIEVLRYARAGASFLGPLAEGTAEGGGGGVPGGRQTVRHRQEPDR